jgi:hypothetical protein
MTPRRYFSKIQNEKRYGSPHAHEFKDVVFEYSIYRGIKSLLSFPRFIAQAIKNKITKHC